MDPDYTALILEYTLDPLITTELVDHLPASETVPTPLDVLGRIPGTPNELTYYREIVRYLEALDRASDRLALVRIGRSAEGREIVTAVVADADTIATLDRYRTITSRLTDPRHISPTAARALVAEGKPVYYVTAGTHAPETGGPEMLMELAYRLAVGESEFVRTIRERSIVVLTPVTDVDGRERVVDTFYYAKRTGRTPPPLLYWGERVGWDANRDALALGLELTRTMMAAFLDWHPTVWHDLHESTPYLYTSTGMGPYNPSIDPQVVQEWRELAEHEIDELARRRVPGVWTGGFYDGWTPSYLFFIANLHNSIGRFYETQGYGPETRDLRLEPETVQRHRSLGTPPLPTVRWGPRSNVNLQQSALLLAMHHVALHKETFLRNYYLKNQRAITRGRTRPPHAWIIPAGQRRRVEAVGLVNLIRRQGAEVHVLDEPFAGTVVGTPGDFVVRMDQPYAPVVETLLDTQFYPHTGRRPYDDTGWSLPLLRNVDVGRVSDRSILAHPMTLLDTDAVAVGDVTGRGPFLIVEHATDNTLATLRFAHRQVRMLAAEEAFEAGGRRFLTGAFVVAEPDPPGLEQSVIDLGLRAHRVEALPSVRTHELDPPRVGLVHTWTGTQDEGWVRLALDRFDVPYAYVGDQRLRTEPLRRRFDVIILPHIDGPPQVQVNGLPLSGDPIPYRRTDLTPHLGQTDSSEDIRGGMGATGLARLMEFVRDGGTLILEGATATIPPTYGVVTDVVVEHPPELLVPGSVLWAEFADPASPIAHGYPEAGLPVYFRDGPVVGVREPNRGTAQEATHRGSMGAAQTFREAARAIGLDLVDAGPAASRVVMRFPEDVDRLLLSGLAVGGESLSGRAVVLDVTFGDGHIVMFANRPFWRWETQGSFFLCFNAILHWNDLSTGDRSSPRPAGSGQRP